jgi:WD40 repeat protein
MTTTQAQFEPQDSQPSLEYERQLWQARYSPCGRFLVASGYDATVQRWDISAEAPVAWPPLLGHNGWVQGFDFAPDNRLLTADSWGQLACWRYEQPEPQRLWSLPQAHPGWIRAVAVSPDGKCVATGGNDSAVRLWSVDDGSLLAELAHPDRVFSLVFHPSGKSLASGDLLGVIRDWDLESGTIKRQLDASPLYQLDRIQQCGGARQLAFDSGGRQLACAGQKTPGGGFATGFPCVLVFDWEKGSLVREMQVGANDDGFAYDARFHPDGFVMAASCAFPGKGHLWFWRPDEEKPFYESKKIPNGRSLSMHPDGKRLALLVSLSANGNGRMLKDGKYQGGSARIHFLGFPSAS